MELFVIRPAFPRRRSKLAATVMVLAVAISVIPFNVDDYVDALFDDAV